MIYSRCTECIRNCTIATYQISIGVDDNILNDSHNNDTIIVELSKLLSTVLLTVKMHTSLVNFPFGTTAGEDARADVLVPRHH